MFNINKVIFTTVITVVSLLMKEHACFFLVPMRTCFLFLWKNTTMDDETFDIVFQIDMVWYMVCALNESYIRTRGNHYHLWPVLWGIRLYQAYLDKDLIVYQGLCIFCVVGTWNVQRVLECIYGYVSNKWRSLGNPWYGVGRFANELIYSVATKSYNFVVACLDCAVTAYSPLFRGAMDIASYMCDVTVAMCSTLFWNVFWALWFCFHACVAVMFFVVLVDNCAALKHIEANLSLLVVYVMAWHMNCSEIMLGLPMGVVILHNLGLM